MTNINKEDKQRLLNLPIDHNAGTSSGGVHTVGVEDAHHSPQSNLKHQPSNSQALSQPALPLVPNPRNDFDTAITKSNEDQLAIEVDFVKIKDDNIESAKVKDLMDENKDELLLHPLVQVFVHLKWVKVAFIFWILFGLKCLQVGLLTWFVYCPYYNMRGNTTSVGFITFTSKEQDSNNDAEGTREWTTKMIIQLSLLAILMLANIIIEIVQLFRNFNLSLRLFAVIMSSAVLVFSAFFVKTWEETMQFDRTIVALIILWEYGVLWAHCGYFLAIGHSVRIYQQVFEKLAKFIVPHLIPILGFNLAFSLIFAAEEDYSDILRSTAKTLSIMAGDVSFPKKKVVDDIGESWYLYFANVLMVYIFAFYALTVGIVLVNTLIGLAVADTSGMEQNAKLERIKKKITLLNSIEASSSCIRELIRLCDTNQTSITFTNLEQADTFCSRLRKLFRPTEGTDSTLWTRLKKHVNPFGDVESKLSSKLKKMLIEHVNKTNMSSPGTADAARKIDADNQRASTIPVNDQFKDKLNKLKSMIDACGELLESLGEINKEPQPGSSGMSEKFPAATPNESSTGT